METRHLNHSPPHPCYGCQVRAFEVPRVSDSCKASVLVAMGESEVDRRGCVHLGVSC